MEKNITATVNCNSVTVKVWNNNDKSMYTTDVTFFGNYDEKRKNAIRNDYSAKGLMVCKFYDETLTTITSERYGMPETVFYTNAEVMEKRPSGDYISRTATASKCKVLVYNQYTDDTEIKYHIISGKNAEKVQKAVEKLYKKTDCIVLDIEITETINALYVMSAEKFFAKATRI